jgi:hypothetical protein
MERQFGCLRRRYAAAMLEADRRAPPTLAASWLRVRPMLRSPALPWVALACLVVLCGAFLYHETRGTAMWFDEWIWVVHRRGGSLATFLDPYNEHLSLVPIAIYKLLFATAGIRDYVPYRVMIIAAHLGCCVLLFIYARRRVGAFLAVVGAGLLVLFGPGWQNIIWPFQIAWLISLAAGLGALILLERGERTGDVAASLLLAVAIASSSIGVPFALGAAVELAFVRRHLREAWIVAAPLVLYGLWWIGYQNATFVRHDLVLAPSFAVNAAGAALAALAGLGGSTSFDQPGTLLTWGPMLLLGALALAALRLARLRRLEARVAALATVALSFWLLTAVSRATITQPYSSRYLYVSAFLIIVLAVELSRGTVPGWRTKALVGFAAAGAIVSNFGAMRDAARLLRAAAKFTTADLGALEIGRPLVRRDYISDGLPGYPFVILTAGGYFEAARSLGTPAAGPSTITGGPEGARMVADEQLIHIHGIRLQPANGALRLGAAPPVDAVGGGSATRQGACVVFKPASFSPVGATVQIQLPVPSAGLTVRAGAAATTVGVRRFAEQFQTVGTLAPGAGATLRIAPDLAAAPWHLQLIAAGGGVVCGLS